jgi:hypothetical protein
MLPIGDACSGPEAQILLQGRVTSIATALPVVLYFCFTPGSIPEYHPSNRAPQRL